MTGAPPEKFSGTAKTLHWITALLVLVAILFSFGVIPPGFEGMPLDERLQTLMIHSGNGILVLALTLYRIRYRRTHTPPAYPATMPEWQKTASRWNVYGLYALLIYQPIIGIVHGLTYVDGNIVPYGLFNLTGLAPSDAAVTQVFHALHGIGGLALSALIIVHVAAAMKHWLIDRDKVFQRMLPFGRV
ncbi:cytochrome b [Pyruvatibacter sp.]|uniref:cytochrome b n=1 Tax=Pyruvatibacter sp. TaxID=1981328 RepID=UPI0032EE6882